VELVVVICIIAILSGIVLFGAVQYINKGKDSNISGSLAVLIPAGEVFYNGNSNSYEDFCGSVVVKNIQAQMPPNSSGDCLSGPTPGICCDDEKESWAACAREFADLDRAYCVDSRGIKEEICNSSCTSSLTQCPDPATQTNCS